MRTTITLDDDIAAELHEEMLRSGKSFKDTVNTVLRRGLHARSLQPETPALHPGRELGTYPRVDIDNIEELLDQIEGVARR